MNRYLILVLASAALSAALSVVGCSSSSSAGADAATTGPAQDDAGVDAAPIPTSRGAISWAGGPALPRARDHHASFIVDPGPSAARFLYVAGGYLQNDGALTQDVSRVHVGDDGALGAWEKVAELPVPVSGAGVAVTHGLVILTGGFNASTTWVSAIQPDGSLGPWKAGPKLAGVRFHGTAVAFGDFVYSVGGLAGTKTTDEIARSTIAGGALGPWEVVAHLPYSLSHHATVLDGDTLYVISGQTGNTNDNSGAPHKEVQIATFGSDGSLGAWTQGPSLPEAYLTHASFIHGGALFLLGGVRSPGDESTGVTSSNVLSARVLGPGSLDAWTLNEGSVLPGARSHVHQVPVYGNHCYSLSGRDASDVDQAAVSIGTLE